MSYIEYAEAGFHVFGLHGGNGKQCACGDPQCDAAFKHPRTNSWQKTPLWSDDQLSVMDDIGYFDTGFGVVVRDNLLVVDVDPRNGGFDSASKLPIDLRETATFIVATGGGGFHYYYRIPDGVSLSYKIKEYDGIEFKTSGFVVGYGSMHASGAMYEVEKGDIDTIGLAPDALVELLKRPERHRTQVDGQPIDVSDNELIDMLSYINPDSDYDTWVRSGMAIHEVTGGMGFKIWDDWSSKGSKYNAAEMDHKWHSFGRSSTVVTLGTLKFYAEQGGYQESVTFETDIVIEQPNDGDIDLSHIDLLRPPGLVGDLAEWITKQCRYPRERLAVAAALTAIGNLGGVKYIDGHYGATLNLFTFCVAGSATGKDDVMSAMMDAMIASGMNDAFNGTIKSEQEIVRALLHSPEVCFVVDEIGILLAKIANATKRGGASYLEGIIGMLMQVYSKCNKRMPLSFDVRKDAKETVLKELASIQKRIDQNEKYDEDRFNELQQMLVDLQYGLNRPFLSLIGFTTPVTFNNSVNHEQTTNGFIGRSILVQEKETNPKRNKRYAKCDLPMGMQLTMIGLHEGAKRSMDKIPIPTTEDGIALLEQIYDELHEQAESMKVSGLEAVARRAFELVLKVSIICAVGEGVRTIEHIKWAYAFIKADIIAKTNLAAANIAQEYKALDEALMRRIIDMMDDKDGISTGMVCNRLRNFKKDDVIKALSKLESVGVIACESIGGKRGRPSKQWFAKDVSKVMTMH